MTEPKNHIDCKACLSGIGDLKQDNGEIRAILESLNGNMMKIFFALLGIITASVGTKYIGTPIYVYVAVYMALVSATFVAGITIAKRRCLAFWEIWIRAAFCTQVFYSSALRVYHYQTQTKLTQVEGVFSNVIYLLLAVGFITLAWKRDSARKNKKRRYDDV